MNVSAASGEPRIECDASRASSQRLRLADHPSLDATTAQMITASATPIVAA